jgi:hypothetical protein
MTEIGYISDDVFRLRTDRLLFVSKASGGSESQGLKRQRKKAAAWNLLSSTKTNNSKAFARQSNSCSTEQIP